MNTLGVEKIEAVADRGYLKIEDIEACEKADITAYVPKPIRGPAVAQGFFSKKDFSYDLEKDVYLCPAEHMLSPRHFGKSRDNVKIDYINRDACKACHLRERCTKSFRRVSRPENEAVLDRMAASLGNGDAGCESFGGTRIYARKSSTSWRHAGLRADRRAPVVGGAKPRPRL